MIATGMLRINKFIRKVSKHNSVTIEIFKSIENLWSFEGYQLITLQTVWDYFITPNRRYQNG